MKKYLLILSFFVGFLTYSQDVWLNSDNNGSTFRQCSGNFYDDGGPSPASGSVVPTFYLNDQNNVVTICPDESGYLTRIIFSELRIEVDDILTVYDGDMESYMAGTAPVLKVYNGSLIVGITIGGQIGVDTVQATSNNITGCLTFHFVSDNDKNNRGWMGAISCFYPCQPIIASALYGREPDFSDLIPANPVPIKLCKGDEISFRASGFYPLSRPEFDPLDDQRDSLYEQSDLTSTFTWYIEGLNGNAQENGFEATHTFDQDGVYHVFVEIKDANPEFDCFNTNFIEQVYWVSTDPMFTETRADRDTICLGEFNTLFGVAEPVEALDDCTPPVGDPAFIPDGIDEGSGLTYESSSDVRCYSGQVVQNVSDISSICLDLEHTYLGDLRIRLTCPTGQSVSLLSDDITKFQWLGSPIDIPGNTNPGTPLNYCFSMDATQTMHDYVVTEGVGQQDVVDEGNYLPEESFANLIGCDFNGTWTISVEDVRVNDNGWVMGWQLNFDPGIEPTSGDGFTPEIVEREWEESDGNPALVFYGDTLELEPEFNIMVMPLDTGRYCFTFKVVDDFGCDYDEEVCFYVKPNKHADFMYVQREFCPEDTEQTPIFEDDLLAEDGEAGIFTATPEGLEIDSLTGVFNPAGSEPGVYIIRNTVVDEICLDVIYEVEVEILERKFADFMYEKDIFCGIDNETPAPIFIDPALANDGESGVFTADPATGLVINPSTGVILIGSSTPGTYTIINTVEGVINPATGENCEEVTYEFVIQILPEKFADFMYETAQICQNAGNQSPIFSDVLLAQDGEGGTFTSDPVGLVISADGIIDPASSTVGVYIVTNTVDGEGSCPGDVYTFAVEILPIPEPIIEGDLGYCTSAELTVNTPNDYTSFDWSDGVTDPTSNFTSVDNPITVTVQAANGCFGTSPPVSVNFLGGDEFFETVTICQGASVMIHGVLQSTPDTYSQAFTVDGGGGICDSVSHVTLQFYPSVNAGEDQAICADPSTLEATVTLTASFPDGEGTFTWNPNVTNGTPFQQGVGTVDYTVTGVDVNSCTTNDVVRVRVEGIPNVEAGNNVDVCAGGSVTLTATGDPGLTYSWSPTAQNGVAFFPSSSGIYTVTGTSALGCSNTDQLFIDVYTLPTVNVPNNQSVCEYELPVTLTASGNADSYTWNDGLPNGGDRFPPIGTTTFTATGTITYAATNGPLTCTNTRNTSVTVRPRPVLDNISEPTVCQGAMVTLTATGANTYVWTDAQGNLVTMPFLAPNPPNAVYTVVGTSNFGCQSLPSNATVTVTPTQDAGFTYNKYTFCLSVDSEGNADDAPVATITGVTGGTFSFTGPGNLSGFNSTTGNFNLVGSNSGTYTITYTTGAPCSGSSTRTIVLTNTFNSTFSYATTCDEGIVNPILSPGSGLGTFTSADPIISALLNASTGEINVTGVPSGTYTVTNTIPASGACLLSASDATITINETPIVSLTADPITICRNETAVLEATSTIPGTVFTWNNGLPGGSSQTVSPTTQTSYTVTGTSNGCMDSETITVNVNQLPNVTINTTPPVCEGGSATLAANGAASYEWSNGATTSSIIVTPTNGQTFTVTGTGANGCSNTASVNVVVNSLPSVVAGTYGPLCSGNPLTLSASGVPAGMSFTWSNGGIQNAAIFPTQTTTYTVTATNTATGCQSSDNTTVVVNPRPIVQANASATEICPGEFVTLVASGNATSYSWDSNVENGVAFAPGFTADYLLTGAGANGCTQTSQIRVTVKNAPVVEAPEDRVVCEGTQTTLTATGNAATYTWTPLITNGMPFVPLTSEMYYVTGTIAGSDCTTTDSVFIQINQIPTMNPVTNVPPVCAFDQVVASNFTSNPIGADFNWTNNTPGIGLAASGIGNTPFFTATNTTPNPLVGTITVIPSNGICEGAPVTYTITVNPTPVVTPVTNINACVGNNVNTDILVTPATSTINWTNTNTSIGLPASGSGTPLSFEAVSSGNAVINVTSTLGNCTSPSVIFSININDAPNVEIIGNPVACEGQEITLSGQGALNYVWDQGVVNEQPFPASPGTTTYTVTGTDANGCTNTASVTLTTQIVPTASFLPSETVGSPIFNVDFVNNSSNATDYVWDFDNGTPLVTTSSTATQNQSFIELGTYDVMLTAIANGCRDSVTITITVEPFAGAIIYVPNVFTPNGDGQNDGFYVDVTNNMGKEMFVQIFNRWGNLVFEINDFTTKWDGTVNGKDASAGVYFYKYRVVGMNDEVIEGNDFVTLIREKQ
jgi:gliding motility-associated-like protein